MLSIVTDYILSSWVTVMHNIDPAFVSQYDPTLRGTMSTFGFPTNHTHSHLKKSDRFLEIAGKIATYIPLIGIFGSIGLEELGSDVEKTYQYIAGRILTYKYIALCNACDPDVNDENLQEIKEILLRQSRHGLDMHEHMFASELKSLKKIKKFIGITPVDQFTLDTVQVQKEHWEAEKDDKKIKACDKLLRLLEEWNQIDEEDQPKLQFLKEHYPGADRRMKKYMPDKYAVTARMLLSAFGIGVVVLPVIDTIATIHNEYKAYAHIRRNKIHKI